MRCSEIGQAFVDHYRSRGFSLVPGSSLLHPSIPMSFVMSAGLAQVEGASEHGAPRVGDKQVMMQTCFRHFDVARIGIDDMHLSLFDMPAAFSFSALTQSEVIEHLWALLTRVLGLPSSRLWVTYYVGGQVSGYAFDADVETSRTWQSLGVPPDRIVGHGIEQNFWKQGNGIEGQVRYHKCGPSTEVFFDRSPAHACGVNCVPPCSCGRFVECANSLFVSTEIDSYTSALKPMPVPFFEAVIGTERVASVVLPRPSVFETDVLAALLRTIREFVRSPAVTRQMMDRSEKVLADHVRALLFLVADGAPPPDKDGRSRLVRILIRRIVAHQMILGISSLGFLPAVTGALVEQYEGDRALRLKQAQATFMAYMAQEAPRFGRAVVKGEHELARLLAQKGSGTLTGVELVDLEKRHGMPNALLEAFLERRGLAFDREQYGQALEQWQASMRAETR